MGTRSLTVFLDEQDRKEIVVLYRQFDGYVDGHGKDLANFLSGFKIVNGLPISNMPEKIANGMGCLAAQVIAHFKKEPGGFYVYPSGTRNVREEYIYTIHGYENDEPKIQVVAISNRYGNKLLFNDYASKYDKFLKTNPEL